VFFNTAIIVEATSSYLGKRPAEELAPLFTAHFNVM
jgi:hypothetical protein